MRRAFTMIELIFVIVIIGILAVLAISKFTLTRDDAKIVTELENLTSCIQYAGSEYTVTSKEKYDSASCSSLKCFAVTKGNTDTDGKVEVTGKKLTNQWCIDATKKAFERKLVSTESGGKKIHEFGGSRLVD